eukprot:TRINITY_DN62472_c0_g1_i1.p1 TRINITY_DN62472_c0_g1~~TRINITY_DN62472_c0_g1_i1.p1  ORF type:complete len:361 (-),score=169.11 TRINITY_DN62472_c0_g1_i1:23-1105(-)
MLLRRLYTTGRASVPRLTAKSSESVAAGMVGSIGNTPLIHLESLSRRVGRQIFGKAEQMSVGGSVKDRAALGLIVDAEEKGLLKPGGVVVEGTAGNTGIGLAHICLARGYKCVIFMPDTQSQEKIDLLRSLGCDVRPVPAVAYEDPQNYNHQAQRFAEETPGAYWTNQFDNLANRAIHYETTGPEIWHQLDGKVDGFVCATGTGGTLAGVSRYLKEKSDGATQIWLADPPGSVLKDVFTNPGAEIGPRSGSSITEGIGQGRVTNNLADSPIDKAIRVDDEESIAMVFDLLANEGISVGSSSALNVVAAIKMAQALPEGSSVATVICDSAARYQSRLFNRAWIEAKGLLDAIPEEHHKFLS